jgi:hypothetical protein
MLYVCEMPENRLVEVYNGNIKGYICRMIYLNAFFPKSPFQQQERSITHECLDLNESIAVIEENEVSNYDFNDIVERFLEREKRECEKTGQYPFVVELFRLWQKEGSLNAVSKKTKIPYGSVANYIKEIIRRINEDFNRNQQNADRIKLS